MMGKLYVGNLPWKTTENDLNIIFSAFGAIHSVRIIKDRDTGKSKGFAFVEMDNSDEAMEKLDGSDMDGRPLTVNIAKEKPFTRK